MLTSQGRTDKMKRATVEEEKRKNPQLKQADIDTMREWVDSQPHLPPVTGRPIGYEAGILYTTSFLRDSIVT